MKKSDIVGVVTECNRLLLVERVMKYRWKSELVKRWTLEWRWNGVRMALPVLDERAEVVYHREQRRMKRVVAAAGNVKPLR